MSSCFGKTFTLAVAATLATLGGCSSSHLTDGGTGQAQVNVSMAALTTDIGSVRITISGGSPALSAPIVNTLTGSGGLYTGTIAGIPAGAGRLFVAEALNGSGSAIYRGQATVDIAANATAQVYILAQEVGGGGSTDAFPPIIDSLTATAAVVAPGGAVNLAVAAHSARIPPGTLTYGWSATCYPIQASAQNGSFGSATAASTTWTAPNVVPANCVLRVDVKEGDLWSVGYLIVAVQSADSGIAKVTVYANTWPVVLPANIRTRVHYSQPNVSGDPPLLTTNTVAHMRLMTVSDPDGDDLAYAWSSDCGGSLAPMVMSGMDMGPGARILTIPDGTGCNVTVVVTDLCTAGNCNGLAGLANGSPRGGSTSVVFHVPAKWSTTPIAPPDVPTAVAASLAGNASVSVSFTPPVVPAGGSPVSQYAVTSSPGGFLATGTSSPITVPCTGSCAGQTFTVVAYNAGGAGPASAPTNVVTSFGVVATWWEPMTNPRHSIFTGSFTLDSTTRTVSGLQGSLTQSMTPMPMTTVALANQLSVLPDGLGGNGQLVTTFRLPSVDTFSPLGSNPSWPPAGLAPSLATWWPGGEAYFGYPAVPYPSSVQNAYAMILVDTDAPAGTANAAQLRRIAYADCTPMGMMAGWQCMTGTDATVYGRPGTMGAYPLSQVITRP